MLQYSDSNLISVPLVDSRYNYFVSDNTLCHMNVNYSITYDLIKVLNEHNIRL